MPPTLINRAKVYEALGKIEEAKKDYYYAISQNYIGGWASGPLAMIYLNENQIDSFYLYMEKAVNSMPKYDLKNKLEKDTLLQKIKDQPRFKDLLK